MPKLRHAHPLLLAAAAATTLEAQCHNSWQAAPHPGVDGTVETSVTWDPDGAGPLPPQLVIGGAFSRVDDLTCRNIAIYDLTTRTWADVGGGTDLAVRALTALPNGDLIAAGDFSTAGGIACGRVARWNGTDWQPVGAGVDGAVHAVLSTSSGDLIAGGNFHQAGAGIANYVARWNGTSWSPLPGFNGAVLSLCEANNGDIVAGGRFTQAGGSPASRIARWNGTSWSALGAGTNNDVAALIAMANGDIIAAGWFGHAGGIGVNHIARWDGSVWSPLGAGLPGPIRALAIDPNGHALAGGGFNFGPVSTIWSVARWDGTSWHSLGLGLSPVTRPVKTITVLPNGDVVTGGEFLTALDDLTTVIVVEGLARWDGATWSGLGTGFNNPINDLLAMPNGDLIAVGGFSTAGGREARGIAIRSQGRWSPIPGAPQFHPAHSGVMLPDGSVIVAGEWQQAAQLQHWDGTTWSSLSFPMPRPFALLAEPGGDLLVGTKDGTVWKHVGGSWNQFPPFPGPVQNVAAMLRLPNGDLLVGGSFDFNGSRVGVLHWDGAQWLPHGGGLASFVHAFARMPNGDIIAGGAFTTATGIKNIARWDGVAWRPFGNLHSSMHSTSPAGVQTLEVLPTGELLAGGTFDRAGTELVHNIARWDGSGWSRLGFGLNGDSPLTDIVKTIEFELDGTIAVGGGFTSIGFTLPSPRFAQHLTTCPATVTPIATTCTGPSGAVSLVANSMPWIGSTFHSTAIGFAPNALGVAIVGFGNTATPLSQSFATAVSGCDLNTSADAILLTLPQNGSSAYSIGIPRDPLFGNLTVYHQFLQLELTPQGQLGPVTSSNALALRVGML